MENLLQLQNGSDIRGVAMDTEGQSITLSEEAAYAIAYSFAQYILSRYNPTPVPIAVVGCDSRLTGDRLKAVVLQAFASAGFTAYDASLTSTPAIFMSTIFDEIKADCGIMITASHLPYDRNGMKFFTKDGGMDKQILKNILLNAEELPIPQATYEFKPVALTDIYSRYLVEIIREKTGRQEPFAGKKIIVDAGNGSGGFFADNVLVPLGADTTGSIFLEPDGYFPNHIPNPENAAVMQEFSQRVVDEEADLGIIFDTDVDRAAVADKTGRAISRNALVALMSAIVLADYPGACIVTDSVTSSSLTTFIERLGGTHHRYKRGYKNVIDEAIRLNELGTLSPLAIETSGHCALIENHFLDDGAYMAVKILILFAQLAQEGKVLSDIICDLKEPAEALELRLNILCDDFKTYGSEMLGKFESYAMSKMGWSVVSPNYEGVRIEADGYNGGGWALMRLSLHDPVIAINIESDRTGGAAIIKQEIVTFLKDFEHIQ